MKKVIAIQRNKLASAYGGAGSLIDTIDNLSYQIEHFDKWPIYDHIERKPGDVAYLIHREDRLIARLKSIGFDRIRNLFLTDDFDGEEINDYDVKPVKTKRMVSANFFPRWFFCPKCNKMHSIDKWREEGLKIDPKWNEKDPKCSYCMRKKGPKTYGPKLQQVRFVLASMETGEIIDIPWDKVYAKKGKSDIIPGVWDFRNGIDTINVSFHVTKGSSDLNSIYVRGVNGIVVTMTEIVNRYFVMKAANGQDIVYRPVVKNANNVYFPYVIQSVYIPKHDVSNKDVERIKEFVELGIDDSEKIKKLGNLKISAKEIKAIIENNYIVPPLTYSSDLLFRLDEFDNITDASNYDADGRYVDDTGERLESVIYHSDECIPFVKQLYLLRRLNVTAVQVGYSRIDKISPNDIARWKGRSENPKFWLNLSKNKIDKDVNVAIHPTCSISISGIKNMPAVSSMGEGFMVVLDLEKIKNPRHKEIFLHTFSHLIMKSLEFQCGYPIASMNERLYVLPKEETGETEDKYGFMIYSANGEAGSYGGISSLFDSHLIDKILIQSLESAEDCPNDPICESEGGSCFACVQIPETACERFNSMLSRNIVNQYRYNKHNNPPIAEEKANQSFISEIVNLVK